MKKKKIFILMIILFLVFFISPVTASADSLNDNINEQLGNLDLSEIEEYLNSLTEDERGVFEESFLKVVEEILNGEAEYSISDVFSVFFSGVLSDFARLIPHFAVILAISVLCGLITASKSNYLSESIKEVVFCSDGYRKPFHTLEESEKYLKHIREVDPLCYKEFAYERGFYKKQESYDDRAYIRFEI